MEIEILHCTTIILFYIMYRCGIPRRFLCAGCLETSRCRDTGQNWTNPVHPVQRAPKWRTPFLAWQREQLGPRWLVWPSTWQLSSLVKATQSGDAWDQEYYMYDSGINYKLLCENLMKVHKGHLTQPVPLLNPHDIVHTCMAWETIPSRVKWGTCWCTCTWIPVWLISIQT